MSGNGQFCYDENNTVIGLDGTVRDITERRQLEQALRDSESQFRGLFENTKVGIAIRRGEKIVFANQAFAQQFGYDTPSDLTALASITEILSEEERARFRQIYEQRDRGEAPEYSEFRGLHKDGSTIWIEQWAKESPGKAAPRILPSQ